MEPSFCKIHTFKPSTKFDLNIDGLMNVNINLHILDFFVFYGIFNVVKLFFF